MKKISLLISIFLIASNFSFSQIDFKGGFFASVSIPIGLYAGAEYGIEDDFGIELAVVGNPGTKVGLIHTTGTAITLSGRYYFSPKYGLDRFYSGMYIRPHTSVVVEEMNNFFFSPNGTTTTTTSVSFYRDSGVGIGFLVGKKFVSKNKYFFDLNMGLGRNIGRKVFLVDVPVSRFGSPNDRVSLDVFLNLVFGFRL